MKRSKRKKYEKKEEDRGQREADAEDCIGNVWRTRENRGRGFRLLGENAKVRMKVCMCVRETEWKCSEFAVISLNGVDSFPGWKARHEIERLRNNRTTRTPPRFLSRFYFSSFFVEIGSSEKRCTKLREKSDSQGPRHARASFCGYARRRACLVSAPETCSISRVLHHSRYFYLSAESHAACWRTPVALKGAKFNRVPREMGVAKHAARSQPLSCYPQKG